MRKNKFDFDVINDISVNVVLTNIIISFILNIYFLEYSIPFVLRLTYYIGVSETMVVINRLTYTYDRSIINELLQFQVEWSIFISTIKYI